MTERNDPVVVVDDDPQFLQGCALSLEMDGYKVKAFPTAEEALSFIEESPASLVLSDLELPGMSGINFLEVVRKRGKSMPFLLFTSFGSVESNAKLVKMGGQEYMVKPFSLDFLSKKVFSYLGQPKTQTSSKGIDIRMPDLKASMDVLLGSSLEIILDVLFRNFGIDEAAVLVKEEQLNSLVVRVAGGPKRKEILGKKIEILDSSPPGEMARFSVQRLLQQLTQVSDCYTVPLFENGALSGVLFLGRNSQTPMSSGELEKIKSLAQYAGTAIQGAKAFHALQTAYQQLEVAHRQILEQEKLSAVGRLAAGIAHDFNNVLSGIQCFVQEMMTQKDLPPPLLSDLKDVNSLAEEGTQMVRQILDFSRGAPLKLKLLNLEEVLKDLLKKIKYIIPGNILVKAEWEPGNYLVMADPSKLQQVLSNLLINASDAMPQGGELSLRLSCVELKSKEQIPCLGMGPGKWVVLSVSDAGTGISPENLPHIFEPFFTTKEPGKGTGLGLSQVYGLVKQMEGFTHVESTVGQGTTINVYLPFQAS
ncbi:MAG: response regulator [Elusimicrobia bacterium]|nr:response regulator [Elusimicrobiota bacterium]